MTTPAQLRAALADVVAIPVTPFGEDGAVDRTAYRAVVRRLLDGGVKVVTPNGNTGEFYALTRQERHTAVHDAVAEASGEALVVVGVGHDVATAAEDARQAADAGAQLVMVHQPVHPYVALDGWVEYHRQIADAVPGLGVVPYLRSPRITGDRLARLGELCPNVVAVKFSVPNPVHFASVARDAGLDRYVWIAGLAELHAPGYWAVGATGFTSGLANVDPAISLAMLAALRQGDFPAAMKVWEDIRAFEELRAANESADNVTVVKEALAQLGLCRRDVRPPSSPLPPEGREAVARALAHWGHR
jgi:4-hydroxy-tetrahydrodipicolinate synthase